MWSRMLSLALGVTLVMSGALGMSLDSALAHDHRAVGEYELTAGFLNEPALTSEPNGLSFHVMSFEGGVPTEDESGDHHEAEGEPVTGLDRTLQVEVIVGGGAAKKDLMLEAVPGSTGSYKAEFIPTLVGEYPLRIFGTIDGMDIDETFESGPGRFSSVEGAQDLQFPETLPDLGTVNAQVQELQTTVDRMGGSGSSSDSTARALGVVGVVIGLVGLAAGRAAAIRGKV